MGVSEHWAYRRSAHNARPSKPDFDSIIVTHPFHPLLGRRLRILFERRRGANRVFVCEGGGPGTTTLAEEWTDRVGPPALRVLNYEGLADLVKTLRTITDD
jgi:hypothetical protein